MAAYAHGSLVQRVGWYRKELKAVPPEYALQARTLATRPAASEDERRRAAKSEEWDWYGIEARMRQSTLNAIDSLGWGPDNPRRAAYEHSATHQEIERGALDLRVDAVNHVFAYFRSITGAPADGSAAGFIDGGRDRDDLAARTSQIEELLMDWQFLEANAEADLNAE